MSERALLNNVMGNVALPHIITSSILHSSTFHSSLYHALHPDHHLHLYFDGCVDRARHNIILLCCVCVHVGPENIITMGCLDLVQVHTQFRSSHTGLGPPLVMCSEPTWVNAHCLIMLWGVWLCHISLSYSMSNSRFMGPQNITIGWSKSCARRLKFRSSSQHPTVIFWGPASLCNVMLCMRGCILKWYFKSNCFESLILSYEIGNFSEHPLSLTKSYPLSFDMHYRALLPLKWQSPQCCYPMIWGKANKHYRDTCLEVHVLLTTPHSIL